MLLPFFIVLRRCGVDFSSQSVDAVAIIESSHGKLSIRSSNAFRCFESSDSMLRLCMLLRLEGLAVAAVSAVLYARTGASWWLFAALWLAPDLSMLGYLGGLVLGRADLQRGPRLCGAGGAGGCLRFCCTRMGCCRSR